jgi:hypothetical protein
LRLTGDVSADEVLESSGVVEVEVAHYDGFDVLDVVAGRFDGIGKLHLLGIHGAWEKIGEWCAPFLCRVGQSAVLCLSLTEGWDAYDLDVLSTASLEQDQAHVWMLDQDGHDDQVAGLVLWVLIACAAAVGAAKEPVRCEILGLMQHRVISGPLPSRVDTHSAQVEDMHLRALRAEEGGHTSRS